jgi:hypothetical protein
MFREGWWMRGVGVFGCCGCGRGMVSTLVGADTKWGADIWLGVIFFRVTDILEALASVNF